jgi:hypothetical protein
MIAIKMAMEASHHLTARICGVWGAGRAVIWLCLIEFPRPL